VTRDISVRFQLNFSAVGFVELKKGRGCTSVLFFCVTFGFSWIIRVCVVFGTVSQKAAEIGFQKVGSFRDAALWTEGRRLGVWLLWFQGEMDG